MFYFVFEGDFQVQVPWGAYIWKGDLIEGFLRYEFGGGLYLEELIFGILQYINFFKSFRYLSHKILIIINFIEKMIIKVVHDNQLFVDEAT